MGKIVWRFIRSRRILCYSFKGRATVIPEGNGYGYIRSVFSKSAEKISFSNFHTRRAVCLTNTLMRPPDWVRSYFSPVNTMNEEMFSLKNLLDRRRNLNDETIFEP